MSGSDRPSRRRRIAGETRPGAPSTGVPARRVVKKPVVRPGGRQGTPGPETEPDPAAPETQPAVEVSAPTEPPEQVEQADERPDAPAARITPAGRRPSKRRPAPTDEPAPADEPARETPAVTDEDEDDDETLVPLPPVLLPEDEGTPGAGGVVGGRARWRRTAPLALLAVAALVFGVVFGLRGWETMTGSGGLESSHAEAASAAAEAAETILGYRYDQLDDHLERSQALMTPTFGREFETISPALDDLAPQRQIVVEAIARSAAPEPCGTSCSSSETDVLVFVDQARLADGEEQPTVFGNRITMTMVERDGEWLVDDIEAL